MGHLILYSWVVYVWGTCRLLEEGKLAEAEVEKKRVEEQQRERNQGKIKPAVQPRWFT